MPISRRRRDLLRLQFILPQAQRLLVGFHFGQHPTKLRRLLRRHPAMLVEIDRFVGYYLSTAPGQRIIGAFV